MENEEECKLNLDERMQKICEENIEDPDNAELIFGFKKQQTVCKKSQAHEQPPQLESKYKHYYLLEIFLEKIKLIPEPQETDDEFEFLEEEVQKRILQEQERKRNMREKMVAKIKFLDFPTMIIEQDEYKEPDTRKKKKEFKEWERNEDEEEDEEKNWLNELKEKMKQIEREEREKEEAKNRPPDPAVLEKELLQKKLEGAEIIGTSTFFSMIPVELSNAIKAQQMEMRIYQAGDPQKKTKGKFIGETKITICNKILEAIARACCPMIQVPVIGLTKDDIDIYSNIENRNTALVSMLMRLVCMGCTPLPIQRPIPKPVIKKPNEMEILLENLKALGKDGLAGTCPLLKEHRIPKNKENS